jgi:hypothetical protein
MSTILGEQKEKSKEKGDYLLDNNCEKYDFGLPRLYQSRIAWHLRWFLQLVYMRSSIPESLRLKEAVVALQKSDNWYKAVVVPGGSVLRVLAFFPSERVIEAEWLNTRVSIFASDITEDINPDHELAC